MDPNPYETPRESSPYKPRRILAWLPKRQPWRGHVIAIIVGAFLGALFGFGLAMWGLFFPESFPIKED
jgi:hypothetical protein